MPEILAVEFWLSSSYSNVNHETEAEKIVRVFATVSENRAAQRKVASSQLEVEKMNRLCLPWRDSILIIIRPKVNS